MRRIGITVLAMLAWLAAPATPAAAELLSATRAVIAIMADELFLGEAEGHLGGAGTLAIRSQKDPALTCLGEFTSSGARSGSGQLRCSDGATATFHFQRLGVFHGHGSGSFSRGPMSFTYGLAVADAGPYLKLPGGKKLEHNGTEPALLDLQRATARVK